MQKKHEIISFDQNRVWFEKIDNKKVCKKRTSEKEVESLMQASKFLMNKKLNVFEKNYGNQRNYYDRGTHSARRNGKLYSGGHERCGANVARQTSGIRYKPWLRMLL